MIHNSKFFLCFCLLTAVGHSIAMQKPAAINHNPAPQAMRIISILENLNEALRIVETVIAHMRTTGTRNSQELSTLITTLSTFSAQLTNETPRIREILTQLLAKAQTLQKATEPTQAQITDIVNTFQSLTQVVANRLNALRSTHVSIQAAPVKAPAAAQPKAAVAPLLHLLNQTLHTLEPIFTHMQQTNTFNQSPEFVAQVNILRTIAIPEAFVHLKEQLANLIALCDNLTSASIVTCCNAYQSLKNLAQIRAKAFSIQMPQQKAPAAPITTPPLAAQNTVSIALPTTTQPHATQRIECVICSDEKSSDAFSTLSCGHQYCNTCLATIVDGAIKERQSSSVKCPNLSCKRAIEDVDLATIVDRDTLNTLNDIKLQEWLTAQQGTAKQCPTPNCSFQFTNERDYQFTMKCPRCTEQYCGRCLQPHSPMSTCQEAEEAQRLANDTNAQNRATAQWLQQNTRQCPNCRAATQRTEGCNHMTCRKCRHEYCWVCLRDWRNHGGDFYVCADNPHSSANAANQHHQQQQPQQQQQEQINTMNEHLFFARDPRGFENRIPQALRNANFVQRFTQLRCEQQDEWAARITIAIDNDQQWQWSQANRVNTWLQELERIESRNGGIRRPAHARARLESTSTRYSRLNYNISFDISQGQHLNVRRLIELSNNRLAIEPGGVVIGQNSITIPFLQTSQISLAEVNQIIDRYNSENTYVTILSSLITDQDHIVSLTLGSANADAIINRIIQESNNRVRRWGSLESTYYGTTIDHITPVGNNTITEQEVRQWVERTNAYFASHEIQRPAGQFLRFDHSETRNGRTDYYITAPGQHFHALRSYLAAVSNRRLSMPDNWVWADNNIYAPAHMRRLIFHVSSWNDNPLTQQEVQQWIDQANAQFSHQQP